MYRNNTLTSTQWLKTPPDKDKIHPSPKTTQTPYQPPTQWLKAPPIKIKYIPAPKAPKLPINHLHSGSKHPPIKDKIHPSPKTTQIPYQPPTQWLKTIDPGYQKLFRKVFYP